MPTIKYTGAGKQSKQIKLGQGREIIFLAGKEVEVDALTAQAVAKAVKDGKDWTITGLAPAAGKPEGNKPC